MIAAAKNAYGRTPQGDVALIEEWTSTTSSETVKASSLAIGADSTVTLMTNGMTEKYGAFGG
ncbi:MAG TPA: hypothetical protein VGX02_01610, partial [Candidatus Eremiobacteraceae bacterium]|nr:hypothetical protein [Candidatus Eremiobacteraceae bacterium]